ncbi:hypothetical protein PFISCL1PPCAC_22854, partial [Pristionchus fissidentatus]
FEMVFKKMIIRQSGSTSVLLRPMIRNNLSDMSPVYLNLTLILEKLVDSLLSAHFLKISLSISDDHLQQ